MYQLKSEILDQLKASQTVQGVIADMFKRSLRTVQTWVDDNDVILTTVGVLKIIKQHFGVSMTDAIEVRKETAKA